MGQHMLMNNGCYIFGRIYYTLISNSVKINAILT